MLTVHRRGSPCSPGISPSVSPSRGRGSPGRGHGSPGRGHGSPPRPLLMPMPETGEPLPPASPCHREVRGDELWGEDEGEGGPAAPPSDAVFLVGGYAHYNCPYVWVRAGHALLGSFGTDAEFDAPLLLQSTQVGTRPLHLASAPRPCAVPRAVRRATRHATHHAPRTHATRPATHRAPRTVPRTAARATRHAPCHAPCRGRRGGSAPCHVTMRPLPILPVAGVAGAHRARLRDRR